MHLPDPMDNESALLHYWLILAKSKYVILVVTLAAGLLGYFLSRLQVPVYRSHVLVETIRPGGTLAIETNWDIPTRSSAWQMRRTIRKRALLEKVASQITAKYSGKPMQPRRAFWGYLQLRPLPLADAVAMAGSSLRIRETDAAGIVEILCDSSDPRISADFANALVDAYVEEDLQQQMDGAKLDKAGVAERLDRLGAQIQARGVQLRQYASESVLMSDSRDGVAAQRLNQISSALARARTNLGLKERSYNVASSIDRGSLAELPEGSMLRDMENELTALQDQRLKLLQDFQPKHPQVLLVDQQIVRQQAALDKERDNVIRRLQYEYKSALQQQQVLEQNYDSQGDFVMRQLGLSSNHQFLLQEMEQDLNAYENLLRDAGLNTVITAVRSPKLRVVDAAEPAEYPHEPITLQETGNGAINGFCLTVGYLLLGASLKRTLRTKGDVARLLGMVELAAIPASQRSSASRGILTPWRWFERTANESPWQSDPERAHAFAECAEMLALRHRSGTVFAITSPTRGEEKTPVVANLGIALAETGRRVLMIDADTESPQLHEYFGVSNENYSLSSISIFGAVDAVVSRQFREVAVRNLFLLPGARRKGGGSLLLSNGRRLEALLDEFRETFDVILIEGPPVFLAGAACRIHMVDSRVLARFADFTVLVCRSGYTTQSEAIPAIRYLSRDGGRILGGILNDCPAARPKASATIAEYASIGGSIA